MPAAQLPALDDGKAPRVNGNAVSYGPVSYGPDPHGPDSYRRDSNGPDSYGLDSYWRDSYGPGAYGPGSYGAASETGRRAAGMVTQVAVLGGALEVEAFHGATTAVLAIHGIGSQRRQWNWLRAACPELTLITPDLRGRGGSVGVRGPSSIAYHVADMVAVLDRLDLDRVHLVGASMGASVAVEMAVTHPRRVKSLILVDGGFPTALHHRLTPEAAPDAVRDRLAQLDWAWLSVAEYAQFFVERAAPLLDAADPLLADYLEHDLDRGRLRLNGDMLAADAARAASEPSRWNQVQVPVRLLAAEWGTGKDSPPAYSEAIVQAIRRELAVPLTTAILPGADHAACLMTRAGALSVSRLVLAALQ
jgi:pimeloyl-ACP methyl ester carboxylesterase